VKLSRNVSKVIALLTLGALAVASPQASGSGAGRWVQVSPRTTTIEAQMRQGASGARFHLSATLIGHERGDVYGTMEQLPQAGEVDPAGQFMHLQYALNGEYIDLGDGRLYIRAQILLDTVPYGGTELVPVGTLDGQVLGWDQNLGYCPGPIGPIAPGNDPDLHPVDPTEPGGPVAIDEQSVGVIAPPPEPVERSGRFVARWLLF
jgi:hypothetical protein